MRKEDFYKKCVVVKNQKESERVQKRLFDLGFKWQSGENIKPIQTDHTYISINYIGILTFGSSNYIN